MAKKKALKERIKTLERELFIVCCHPESLEANTIIQGIKFLSQMETVIFASSPTIKNNTNEPSNKNTQL